MKMILILLTCLMAFVGCKSSDGGSSHPDPVGPVDPGPTATPVVIEPTPAPVVYGKFCPSGKGDFGPCPAHYLFVEKTCVVGETTPGLSMNGFNGCDKYYCKESCEMPVGKWARHPGLICPSPRPSVETPLYLEGVYCAPVGLLMGCGSNSFVCVTK